MAEELPPARTTAMAGVVDGTVQLVSSAARTEPSRQTARFRLAALGRLAGKRTGRAPETADRYGLEDTYGSEPATSRFPLGKLSLLVCVIIPALVVGLYFAFIASNQFVAEARFVVRLGSESTTSRGGLAFALPGLQGAESGVSGRTSSTEDAHVVTSYIQSRAIVDQIQKSVDLRSLFGRPEADFYARLRTDAPIEELVSYWRSMVSTYVDSMSGIVTVEARAFRPDDAVLLVRIIGELSENLVNDISRRARQDALRRAGEEVERAQALLYEAIRDVERYRNAEGLIDPVQTATETGKILTKVLADQVAVEGELFVARRSLTPDSPAVRLLTSRSEALRQQASGLRAQLAGRREDARNVAASLSRFEEVATKQKMAETIYGFAESALDRARRAAEAQSVYLSVFVPPGRPDEYTYPKRLEYSVAVTAALLVFWAIGALIWLSVEDHRLG